MKSSLFATVTRREQRALMLLVCLGLCGHLIRAAMAPAREVAAPLDLLDHAGDRDPAAHRDSSHLMAMPLRPGERIDADKASAIELGRLPGVGPALARRIVAFRDSNGPFGGVESFDRVAGIGPGLIGKLSQRLLFSGIPADTSHGTTEKRGPTDERTSAGQTGAAALVRGSVVPPGPLGPIDLNTATVLDLVSLPGIGLKRAKSIVAFRDSAGPFREVADLIRVRGITSGVVAALADRLVVQ